MINKRTAREILVKDELLLNKKLTVKIGTVENRDSPQTVYLNINFWIKPKTEVNNTRKEIEFKLQKELNDKLIKHLEKNLYFPYEKENIYIYNIPENFNYNKKPNFLSLEFYFHTLNIDSEKKYPLNAKKNTELFVECLKIANFASEEISKWEENYYFSKSSKNI